MNHFSTYNQLAYVIRNRISVNTNKNRILFKINATYLTLYLATLVTLVSRWLLTYSHRALIVIEIIPKYVGIQNSFENYDNEYSRKFRKV